MKTKYKFIHFVCIKQNPKTAVWSCRNNRSDGQLGVIGWYGPWRQYCFFPNISTVFNVGCMEDINHFIGQLATERKQGATHAPANL